jgi:hypothetical protein
MATELVLILLGALSRLVHLPPNAVPMGALALYAGARLPGRRAWIVPLGAMVLSDLVLDAFVYHAFAGRALFGAVRMTSYATFVAIALLGTLRREAGPLARGGMALGASSLFFLTTNFAVWATDGGAFYPPTPAGLIACYVAGLPFFGNTVAADLVGTAALFGLDPARYLARRKVALAADGE